MSAPTANDTAARLEDYFRVNCLGIAAAYLFGSVARDMAREGSDVDVAVLLEDAPPRRLKTFAPTSLARSRNSSAAQWTW